MKKKANLAQSIIEYCVIIGVVVAFLLGTRIFIIRVLQEKFRQSADVYGKGEQYQKTSMWDMDF